MKKRSTRKHMRKIRAHRAHERPIAHRTENRPYKTVYPKRLLRSGRIILLKARGVTVCPHCGSEAVHRSRDGLHAVCLHCGYGWAG